MSLLTGNGMWFSIKCHDFTFLNNNYLERNFFSALIIAYVNVCLCEQMSSHTIRDNTKHECIKVHWDRILRVNDDTNKQQSTTIRWDQFQRRIDIVMRDHACP